MMSDFLRQCAEKDTLTAEDRKRLVEVADKVAEVVHAEWVEHWESVQYGEEYDDECVSNCSKCGYGEMGEAKQQYNYCRNCGAKMDGQSKEREQNG